MKTAEEIYQEIVNEVETYPYSEFHLKKKYAIQAMERYADQFRHPVVISSVCTCTKFRETPIINGKHICSICNKPIVQTDL